MLDYNHCKPNLHILKNFISSYTYSIGKLNKTSSKYITRAFPSFYTQIYIEFEGNISVMSSVDEEKVVSKRTYVNTGIGKWFDIYELDSNKTSVDIKNFKIDLFPNTLYEVFNLNQLELAKEDLKLEDIWIDKQHCRDLLEELEGSNSGYEMISIFERYFLELLSLKQKNEGFLFDIIKTNNYSLEELSSKLKFSKRWIQKEHKKIYGLNYKELQNSIRFYKCINKINILCVQNNKIDFSLLALEFDYYDQAHFIKDFKKYTGFTPSEYMKNKSKNPLFFW